MHESNDIAPNSIQVQMDSGTQHYLINIYSEISAVAAIRTIGDWLENSSLEFDSGDYWQLRENLEKVIEVLPISGLPKHAGSTKIPIETTEQLFESLCDHGKLAEPPLVLADLATEPEPPHDMESFGPLLGWRFYAVIVAAGAACTWLTWRVLA